MSVKLRAGGSRPLYSGCLFSAVTGNWCAVPAVRYLVDHQPIHVITEQPSQPNVLRNISQITELESVQ